MTMRRHAILWLLATGLLASAGPARVLDAAVERSGADTLALAWSDAEPVDIYQGVQPGFALKDARLITRADRSGHHVVTQAGAQRYYFALVDTRDHQRADVAERVIALAQGSNFRDIGGYSGADGKHVRWGLIYRSGAQPLLTPQDVEQVKALGIGQIVDLRSSEERVIAPTKLLGVPYSAVGYSMADLFRQTNSTTIHNGADIYHQFPTLLAPQLRLIFAHLLQHSSTPIVYNCSAGQDRTGFVTAILLSALGVPRDQIVADYYLSTTYRHPEYEMPHLDPAAFPDDPVLRQFASFQQRPDWKTPQPLHDAQGPFLRGAFDEIDARWGSVDQYLAKEVGVSATDLAMLRRVYLQ
jgi:protein-tyrosine phosphatase